MTQINKSYELICCSIYFQTDISNIEINIDPKSIKHGGIKNNKEILVRIDDKN